MDTHGRIFRISFFISVVLLCSQCHPPVEKISVATISKDDKINGVTIHGITIDEDELGERLKIQLVKPGDRLPVLGDFRVENDAVIFESVVPLTRGLKYEVLLDDTLLSELEIPQVQTALPELLAIFPSGDTLPENLLKMYFEFSAPMVEGSSLKHITLVDQSGDTMKGTFLDLQPELWNTEGTVLTLWLDPGRIKRDLIPNRELGAPLKAGERYTLYVNDGWADKNGRRTPKKFSKTFITSRRDDESPAPETWQVNVPSSEKRQPLEIRFPQPLDYFLAREGIVVKGSNGDLITGATEIVDEERIFTFIPDEPWSRGRFVLEIESRLEDLSGNNLNHPFDRDLEKSESKAERKFFTKEFVIQ